MAIVISPKVLDHIQQKHGVNEQDVHQCFQNRTGQLLFDPREKHRTNPQTQWFVAFTNKARLLKVCFVPEHGNQYVRTAYPPNDEELNIYKIKGKPSDF